MKVSDAEIRLAEWILKKCCTQNLEGCRTCPHSSRCTAWGHEAIPEEWDIPEPPPEPAERPRIDWLRMLPDIDAARAIISTINDGLCAICSIDMHTCNGRCKDGVCSWYCKAISLEQFRKDVGME